MAVKKVTSMGPVLAQVQGLRIRQILKPRDGGNVGIYAGKRLYKSYPTLEIAKKEACLALSTKPSHYPQHQAYLRWYNSKS